MIVLRTLVAVAVLCIAGAANAADDCAASSGLEFVCGPKNAEDLVLVPGTKWIISSGMQAGAAFYLIDSRDGKWSAVQPQAKHDAAFANCTRFEQQSAEALLHLLVGLRRRDDGARPSARDQAHDVYEVALAGARRRRDE